jgi:hypothetical protein
MLARYYVTGWSKRWGSWMPEVIEAANKAAAKERFATKYPSLTRLKVYRLLNIGEKG